MEPGVSVILCCYNGAARLPETLRHLALQRVPSALNWEIIVVDNASTDTTADTARQEWAKYQGKTAGFAILKEPREGKNHAFITGVRAARYTYILTCDDDNWLNRGYIAKAFRIMQSNPLIGALGGCGVFEPQQPVNKEVSGLSSYYVNGPQTWAESDHWVYGAGSVYRKSIFIDLLDCGWQQITTGRKGSSLICGEDVEICFMIFLSGFKVITDNRLTFKHFVPAKRQQISYIIDLSFWLSYTHVLLNSYFAIINKDQRPIDTIVNKWFLSSSKTFAKNLLLMVSAKITWWKPISLDRQLLFSQSFGTWSSLLKNRKKIVAHHMHTKTLLAGLGKTLKRSSHES